MSYPSLSKLNSLSFEGFILKYGRFNFNMKSLRNEKHFRVISFEII